MIISYCLICHENLKKYPLCAEFWEYIIDCYTVKGYFQIEDDNAYISIVDFLEKKGYLITCESGCDSIFIRPTGIHYAVSEEEEPVMCVCKNGREPHEEIVL